MKLLSDHVAAMGPKARAVADGKERATAFQIAPGQAMSCFTRGPCSTACRAFPRVVTDRGYASHRFRRPAGKAGAEPAILSKRKEAAAHCPNWISTNRRIVERLWARLKEWRAVATYSDKIPAGFSGVLCLAAALDHLK